MTLIEHSVHTGSGSMIIDFGQITDAGLLSLRFLCETEATKNPDSETARYFWEAARAIHALREKK